MFELLITALRISARYLPFHRIQPESGKAASGLLALLLFTPSFAQAEGTITNCTDDDFLAALNGGGLVTFACDGTISLSNTITIATHTVLHTTNRNVTISGDSSVRVFNVNPGITFTILNLKIANGSSTNGGGIYNNGGTVIASNAVFSGNSGFANDGRNGSDGEDDPGIGEDGSNGRNGTNGWGGAIYNLGSVSLTQCTFETNSAVGGHGGNGGNAGNGGVRGGNGGDAGRGATGFGGALYNLGSLLASNCTFAGNGAFGGNGGTAGSGGTGRYPGYTGAGAGGASGTGGGLYNLGTAQVVNCTFSGNGAMSGNSAAGGTEDGGANGLDGADGANSLGGAICNLGTLKVVNCTLSGNQAIAGNAGNGGNGDIQGGDGGDGGFGYGGAISSSGTVAITNSTFSGNGSFGGTNGVAGAGRNGGTVGQNGAGRGGHIARTGGTFTLKNSIVATNVGGANGYGAVTDAGHNISSDGSIALITPSSRKNTDPKLASLASNGGFTQTMALLTNSPAIDAADNTACLPYDQRGVARPIGPSCDIGSFEFAPVFQIQGRITDGTNGIAGVQVGITNQFALTATNGNYAISNLLSGTYTVTPDPAGVGFTPTNRTVILGTNATGVDFVANRARITTLILTTNRLPQLSILALPNRNYRIEASTNLIQWLTLSNVSSGTNGAFDFFDVNSTNFPSRFYRTAAP